MNKLTSLFGAVLLLPFGVALACPAGSARCDAPIVLVDARDSEDFRYLESDAENAHGPLSVHVTTFDGSPATPGMWYERPSHDRDDEDFARQRYLHGAPFDRTPFDGGRR